MKPKFEFYIENEIIYNLVRLNGVVHMLVNIHELREKIGLSSTYCGVRVPYDKGENVGTGEVRNGDICLDCLSRHFRRKKKK